MFRWLRCLMQMCPHEQRGDGTGCWGQCVDCGKRVGFVSSADLRAYIEREERMKLQCGGALHRSDLE